MLTCLPDSRLDNCERFSVNYSMYVPQRPCNFQSPPCETHVSRCLQGGGVYVQGGIVTLSSCTISGNTANNVRARLQKFPSPPCETHVARCLQGGGVFVNGGTVTLSSCTISGNTADNVRAHLRKFPWPPWKTHVCFASFCRAAVSLSLEEQRPSHRAPSVGTQILHTQSMCVLMFKSSHRPMGCLSDMPKSTLVLDDGCCLELPV